MDVKSGDWVRTCRHRHHGVVLATYDDCPENEIWVKAQKGLTEQQLAGRWALVFAPLVNTVLVPVSDCEPAEEIGLDGLTEQQLAGRWALVFAPQVNTVLVPVSDCEPAEEIGLDGLPDQIVIEAFGPTEQEARQIAGSLEQLDGTVSRLLEFLKGGSDHDA